MSAMLAPYIPVLLVVAALGLLFVGLWARFTASGSSKQIKAEIKLNDSLLDALDKQTSKADSDYEKSGWAPDNLQSTRDGDDDK